MYILLSSLAFSLVKFTNTKQSMHGRPKDKATQAKILGPKNKIKNYQTKKAYHN
jgi:hypothetical protein